MSDIYLCMIVKNEAHIIKECLECVYKYIKGYVICDTGSTDGTQKVIKDFFNEKGIQGEIYDRPWKNFGHNRSEALRYCDGKKGYAWVIDADDRVNGKLVFPKKMFHDGYMLRLQDGETVYYTVQIFKISSKWKYEAVLHEYPVCTKYQKGDGTDHNELEKLLTGVSKPNGQKMAMIEGDYYIESRRLGDRSKNPLKYHKDAEILQAEVDRDPTNTRNWFYLAQSYNCAGEKEKALKCYTKRTTMTGYLEEVFFSYLCIAQILQVQGKSDQEVLGAFLKAGKYDPERVEPWFELMMRYRNKEKYLESLKWAERGLKCNYSQRMLFTKKAIYEFALKIEYGICLKLLNRFPEALKVFQEVIDGKFAPDSEKERCKQLINQCQACTVFHELKISDKPVICFFTGYMSPYNEKTSYGSELALRELCKVLEKDYNIFIFCDADITGCPPNVMRGCDMEAFCSTVVVQCMIVWRYCYYFIRYDVRVDNHILWIHDVCIHGGFNGQTLPGNGYEVIKQYDSKISHYVTLTEVHKQSIIQQYGINPEKIVNIGNGIKIPPSLSLQRKARRFIWSSAPTRGLEYVLSIWPKILQRWEDAELSIFRGPEEFEENLLSKVKSEKGVKFHGKISQETLSIEFQMSDIWLYPTNFFETYCMSALEALLGGCLCIYTKVGALPEVVGKYGWALSEIKHSETMTNEILSTLETIFALSDSEKEEKRSLAIQYAKSLNWEERGKSWKRVFEEVEQRKIPIKINSKYSKDTLIKYLPKCCNLALRPNGKTIGIDQEGEIRLSMEPPSKRTSSEIQRSVFLYNFSFTLDQMKRLQFTKERTLSLILNTSDKKILNFVQAFGKTLKNGRIDGKYSYDVFSSEDLVNKRDALADGIKDLGLGKYRYSLALESTTEPHHFTDRITDCILFDCVPFYHGCSNLEQYIDPRAFIRIDIENPEEAFQIITKSIESGEYERRLPYVLSSKRRVLNMLLYPTIERILTCRQIPEIQTYLIDGYQQLEQFEISSIIAGYERYERFSKITGNNLSWMSNISKVCSSSLSPDVSIRAFVHASLWEQISESDEEYTMVFEDRIQFSEDFHIIWPKMWEIMKKKDWEVLTLGPDASAYCLRKSGAKKLISSGSISEDVSSFMNRHLKGEKLDLICLTSGKSFFLYTDPKPSLEPYIERTEQNVHLLSYLRDGEDSSFDEVKKNSRFASMTFHNESTIKQQASFNDFKGFLEKRPESNVWKPSLVFDKLNSLPENAILLYCDPSVRINPLKYDDLSKYLDKMEAIDVCAFQDGEEKEYKLTCGGLFDQFKLRNSHLICLTNQLTSRVFFIRNTGSAKKFLQDWFRLLIDEKSYDMSNNMTGFIKHNNDQSVFSVLCKISTKAVKIEENLKGDGLFVSLK